MAMTPCKECGTTISTKANACPSCGAPVRRWRLLKGFLVVLFLFVLVTLLAKPSEEAAKPQDQQQAAPLDERDKFEPMQPTELAETDFSGVSVDDGAIIQRVFAEDPKTLVVLMDLIKNSGYKCDSISVARYKRLDRGISLVCNNFAYSYSVDDKGGNMVVSLED